jgi:putative SOS response-associated peptidase YedK
MNEEAVSAWLDPATQVEAALALLQLPPHHSLAWHPVSTAVGNVKNQEPNLMKAIEIKAAGLYDIPSRN